MTKDRAQPWNVTTPQGVPGHYEQPPDASRNAYAVVAFSFNPSGSRFVFEPGDEVQGILPADVLAACVQRGEVSYEKPDAKD